MIIYINLGESVKVAGKIQTASSDQFWVDSNFL